MRRIKGGAPLQVLAFIERCLPPFAGIFRALLLLGKYVPSIMINNFTEQRHAILKILARREHMRMPKDIGELARLTFLPPDEKSRRKVWITAVLLLSSNVLDSIALTRRNRLYSRATISEKLLFPLSSKVWMTKSNACPWRGVGEAMSQLAVDED